MAVVENPLLAIGGNRHPAAADWSPNGTLAFGGGRCIALWNPNVGWLLRSIATALIFMYPYS
jgi:hypothetical protein